MVHASNALWLANSVNLAVVGLLLARAAYSSVPEDRAFLWLLPMAPIGSAILLYFVADLAAPACFSVAAALLTIAGALKRAEMPVVAPPYQS